MAEDATMGADAMMGKDTKMGEDASLGKDASMGDDGGRWVKIMSENVKLDGLLIVDRCQTLRCQTLAITIPKSDIFIVYEEG